MYLKALKTSEISVLKQELWSKFINTLKVNSSINKLFCEFGIRKKSYISSLWCFTV